MPDEIASVVAMLATNAYITNKVDVFRPFCIGAVIPWLIDYQRFSLLMEVLLRVLSDVSFRRALVEYGYIAIRTYLTMKIV